MASRRKSSIFELIGDLVRIFWTVCKWILVDLGLLRKPATIADLKFPVLVLRPGKVEPIIDPGAGDGKPTEEFMQRPIDGSIVIDSDFRMYTQTHVRCKQGEITMIFRALLARKGPITYRLELKRRWRSGLRPALRQLLGCRPLGYAIEDDDRKRGELFNQTTMAGVIAILGSGRSVPPPLFPLT